MYKIAQGTAEMLKTGTAIEFKPSNTKERLVVVKFECLFTQCFNTTHDFNRKLKT